MGRIRVASARGHEHRTGCHPQEGRRGERTIGDAREPGVQRHRSLDPRQRHLVHTHRGRCNLPRVSRFARSAGTGHDPRRRERRRSAFVSVASPRRPPLPLHRRREPRRRDARPRGVHRLARWSAAAAADERRLQRQVRGRSPAVHSWRHTLRAAIRPRDDDVAGRGGTDQRTRAGFGFGRGREPRRLQRLEFGMAGLSSRPGRALAARMGRPRRRPPCTRGGSRRLRRRIVVTRRIARGDERHECGTGHA